MGGTELSGQYDLSMVVMSVAIAIASSYVALDLAGRVTAAQGRSRLFSLAGSAVAFGVGIWSMHFIGMLAFSLPIPVKYHLPTVVLSLMAAVSASAVAFSIVSGRSLGLPRLLVGSVMMGLAIVAMHYTGMAAMRLQATVRYDPLLWALSVAIAVGVSFAGLTLVFRLRGKDVPPWDWRKIISAIVMGTAIPAMHYTGMAAAIFTPTDEFQPNLSQATNISMLGNVAVLMGTLLILGIAFTLPARDRRQPYAYMQALLVVITVLVLTIGGVSLYYVEQRMIASEGESLALAAADIADKLDGFLYERYGDTHVFAEAAVFRTDDTNAKAQYIAQLQALYPVYLWIGVTDAHGRISASSDPGRIGQDHSQSLWFKAAHDRGGIFVEDARASADSNGALAVTFAAPILGSRGAFLGVITTRVGLPVMKDILSRTIRTFQMQRGPGADTIEWEFLNRDGDVILDSVLHQEGTVNLKQTGLPSAISVGSAQPGYIEEMHQRRHVPVVTGYARTESSGNVFGLHWGVLVRMDRSDIVAPIRAITVKLGAAGLVMFVPLLALLFWTSGRLQAEWVFAQEETARATMAEYGLRVKNAELLQALQEVKVLRGFIPICMTCKKIRNDDGYWQQIESYIQQHSEALFSHSVCQDCYKKISDQHFGNRKTAND